MDKKRKQEKSAATSKKRVRKASSREAVVDKDVLRLLTGVEDEQRNQNVERESPVVEKASEDASAVTTSNETENSEKPKQQASSSPTSNWSTVLSQTHSQKVQVTVLLDNANLETIKQKGRDGGVVLLNCDDHKHILSKTGRNANDARPDITHQCLLALMDSPLNKAGRLKVYIKTAKNVLIEIHPQTRIPRTMKRFSGLMAELLEKFKVRGTSGSTPLLKVIKNPITSYLPVGTRKVICTYNCENIVDIRDHAARMSELALPHVDGKPKKECTEEELEEDGEAVNVLYVVGAMAHGKISEEWADENICVSEYPLSAATVCSRIMYAYESMFGIL